MYIVSKYPKLDNVSEFYLWHCRLGHVNKNTIDRLIKKCVLEIDDCESLLTCESCLLGKMTKSPFKKKDESASDVLGLIYEGTRSRVLGLDLKTFSRSDSERLK